MGKGKRKRKRMLVNVDLPPEKVRIKMRRMRDMGYSYEKIREIYDGKYSHMQIRRGCGVNRKLIKEIKEMNANTYFVNILDDKRRKV